MKIFKHLILIALIFPLSSMYSQHEQNLLINGNKIHIKTFGVGDPILIINGGPGMNSEGFSSLAQELGKNNLAIIYDQRGTGKSQIKAINSKTMTLDLMVNDIELIRKQLKIKKWVVLGHSFGGMLANYYVSKHPYHVKALILSSSGGIDLELFSSLNINSKLTNTERDSLSYWSNKISSGDTSYHAKFQRGKNLAPAYLYSRSHIKKIAHRLTQVNLTINELVFQNMNAIQFDCKENLKNFLKPVLIIQGKEDIIPIKISNKTNEIFSNSKLVIIEKCGHYGWLDQPEIYFKTIEEFLHSL